MSVRASRQHARSRATQARAAPPPVEVPAERDAVAAWLDALVALLRLPEREARPIREELGSHLRDRIDDLMLAGRGEGEATARAIAELGEAARVAERFRGVRRDARRSTIMNATVLLVAGGAAVMSLVALINPGATPTQSAIYQPAPRAGAEQLPQPRLSLDVADASLSEVFARLGAAVDREAEVDWRSLNAGGLTPGSPVTLRLSGATLGRAMARINDGLELDGLDRIDCRVEEGRIRFSTRHAFDVAETVLASYALESVLEAMNEATLGLTAEEGIAQIAAAVHDLVEPETWRENGGDLAMITIVGRTLFVQAPPRHHDRIRWILERLTAGAADARPAG